MNQAASILHKALSSKNVQAIFEVAKAFEEMGDRERAQRLYDHLGSLAAYSAGGHFYGFGAQANYTRIPGTTGMVIPPGRYWITVAPDKQQAWDDWKKGKPEVKVVSTETRQGGNEFSWNPFTEAGNIAAWMSNASPEGYTFYIFVVPTTANNYGLPGVYFPGSDLGIPSIATDKVQSSEDTVSGRQTEEEIRAQTIDDMAKAAGSATKSFGQGLGLSTSTLIKIGIFAGLGLLILPKLLAMTPAGAVAARI